MVCLRPNQKLFPLQEVRWKSPPHGGNPTGGKAVPQVTSKVQPSTIGDEELTRFFTCALASKQSAKGNILLIPIHIGQ